MKEETIIENDRICNELFARFLCENGLVLKDDVLVEYVNRFQDAVAFDDIFNLNTRMVFCNGMKTSEELHNQIINDIGLYNYKINLLANSYSDLIKDAARKVLPYGRFNLGICTDNIDEYKCAQMKLVKFEKDLIATGIKVDEYEREFGEKKLFLISNRRRINGK